MNTSRILKSEVLMVKSYYKVIKGKKCRRDLIEICEDTPEINLNTAERLWARINCKGGDKRL